jgi:carboxypeptidase Q
MRKLISFAFAFATFVCLSAPTPFVNSSHAQSDSQTAQRLADRAIGQTPLMDDLRELCDQIGGRATGSPACERAVQWGAAKFRAAGVADVKIEPFDVPNLWLGQTAAAECVAPEHFNVRLAAAPYSPSTPVGRPLEAQLVLAGDGSPEAFAKLGARARGAIALVTSDEMKTLDDLFAEYLRNSSLVAAARKAQVAALLLQSTRPRGLLYRHPVSFVAQPVPMPVAIVSREHAARLARLAERKEVRVRLNLSNKTGGAYQAHNVIAEIRGRERPDEIVLLGAHLDSWDLGTGAQDNGVNAALVIDVARAIRQLRLQPRRTIRFALFTGEEQGMFGSAGYVKSHAHELDKHAAVVIFDIGSGRTTGFFLNGREELRRPVETALRACRWLGVLANPLDGIDGTDNYDFLLSGVPNLVANQDPLPYLPDYHAESDVFDMVNAQEAKRNAGLAAALVWSLADTNAPLPRRQTRAEVEQLLKATKLDEQMRAFDQWTDWETHQRGVDH